MKETIIKILKDNKDKDLTLKKLKSECQVAITNEGESEFSNDEFDQVIEKLINKEKIIYEGKYLKLKKKRKLEQDVTNDEENNQIENDDEEEENIIHKKNGKKSKIQNQENENENENETSSSSTTSGTKSMKGLYPELWRTGEQMWRDNGFDQTYLLQNPDSITRIFCGNLNKNVTEEQLRSCIENITYIKWITDRETQQFYGSTFLEMKDSKAAITAVMKDKQKFLGRPLKIYYCPPRPGDNWPPHSSGSSGNPSSADGSSNGKVSQPAKPQTSNQLSEKPLNCRKLYCGNLSYNIDDDVMIEFFKECGTLTGLRWLTHRDSGDFRGCAFIEFESTAQADAGIKLNGKELMGRPIKLDWTT